MLSGRINTAMRRVPAWPIYIVCVLAVVWLFWRGASGVLGPDPVKVIERQLGEWAIWCVAAGLAVTPLRRFTGIVLIRYRRAIGLSAFLLVTAHLATWVVLDIGMLLGQALGDIAHIARDRCIGVHRPFLRQDLLVGLQPHAPTFRLRTQ